MAVMMKDVDKASIQVKKAAAGLLINKQVKLNADKALGIIDRFERYARDRGQTDPSIFVLAEQARAAHSSRNYQDVLNICTRIKELFVRPTGVQGPDVQMSGNITDTPAQIDARAPDSLQSDKTAPDATSPDNATDLQPNRNGQVQVQAPPAQPQISPQVSSPVTAAAGPPVLPPDQPPVQAPLPRPEEVNPANAEGVNDTQKPVFVPKPSFNTPVRGISSPPSGGTSPIQATGTATPPPAVEKGPLATLMGNCYLMNEMTIDRSLKLFTSILRKGGQGILICRTPHPRKFDVQWSDKVKPRIYWLSQSTSEIETLDPTNPGTVKSCIVRHIKDCVDRKQTAAVMLEGIEFLISQADYKSVLRLVQQLNEAVINTKSIMIVSIDLDALELKESRLISREMIDGSSIDLENNQ